MVREGHVLDLFASALDKVGNFKSQLKESKSILGAGCEGATKGVLDDEAYLTAYDGIGSEERMLLLKGFVISKMFFGQKAHFFLELRANQADSSQSNEGTSKTSSGTKNTKQGSFKE
ncbi:hypothetical protein Tco_0965604 [Tanacetum coccineum]